MAVDLSEIKKYQNAQTFLFREKLVDLNLVGCGSLANRIWGAVLPSGLNSSSAAHCILFAQCIATAQCILYAQCIVTAHCTLHIVYCMHTAHCTLHIAHCIHNAL